MECGLAEENDKLRRQVLQSTLEEVAVRDQSASDCCVICLDAVSDACELVPCGHDNFDYVCVLSWLYDKPVCPLCKRDVSKVHHGPPESRETTILEPKPQRPEQPSSTGAFSHQSPFRRPQGRTARAPRLRTHNLDAESVLAHRRNVYIHQRFSKHIGSNRLSLYRELTPQLFCIDENLVSRARMWIRRELQVFSFLTVEADDSAPPPGSGSERTARERRRANNAEFLLEYIVAILKTVDIMGSAGQAEDMLSEFIGRENTRLFLHELRSWLRSPFTRIGDWDRVVQYDPVASRTSTSTADTRQGRDEHPSTAEHNWERVRTQGDFYRPSPVGDYREKRRKARYEPYRRNRY